MTNNDDYWFTTYTGKKFYPFNPRIEDIDIEDIAHALSLICRFGGHLPEHYSVAQHSVLVSYLVPIELRLEGLMHDAAEAYIGDVIRPIKKHPVFIQLLTSIENNLDLLIRSKFKLFEFSKKGVGGFEYSAIKKADSIALLTEKRDLFKVAKDQVWELKSQIEYSNLEPHPNFTIPFVHPGFAKQQFLHRFAELKRE
jgi:hypothetical protein